MRTLKYSFISVLLSLLPSLTNSQCFEVPIGLPTSAKNIFCGWIITRLNEWNDNDRMVTTIVTGGAITFETFEQIYNKNSTVTILNEYTNMSCQISICGFSTEDGIPPRGECKLFSFSWEPFEPIAFFHISSLSCGCALERYNSKQNAIHPNQNVENCWTTNEDEVCGGRISITEDDTSCAMLYQETYCTNCYYDGIVLDHDNTFKTENSAAIKSLAVLTGCVVTQTTYGKFSEDFPFPRVINFTGNTSHVDLSYHKLGEEFYCACPEEELPSTTVEPISSTTMEPIMSTTVVPIPSTTMAPISSTTMAPIPSTTMAPIPSTTMAPIPSTTMSPIPSTTMAPIPSTTMAPIPSTTIAPIPSTTIAPLPSTTTEPEMFGGMTRELQTSLATVGGTSIILILLGAVFVIRRKVYQHRMRLSVEEIEEFYQGGQSTNGGEGNESDTSAYTAALRLPYNREIEINKKWLILDIDDSSSILGDGNFGQVYKGELKTGKTLRDVAIKIPVAGKAELQSLVNEIKVMHYIGRHENIVEFIGACTVDLKKAEVYSIMELCPNGSLKSYLIAKRKTIQRQYEVTISRETPRANGYCQVPRKSASMTKDNSRPLAVKNDHDPNKIKSRLGKPLYTHLLTWAMNIASGMGFLKHKKVLHIDLAARNVLLSEDLTAKICDFGLSRKLYDKFVYERKGNGPMPFKWIAPECRTGNAYSESSDVWAYSVTLWEIFSLGSEPYPEMTADEVYNFLLHGQRLPIPKAASREVYKIMLRGWNINPQLRPSFQEFKAFFEDLISLEMNN